MGEVLRRSRLEGSPLSCSQGGLRLAEAYGWGQKKGKGQYHPQRSVQRCL